ncbi:MAG: hypothetical protein H0W84_02885 [Bacteroidetes bacterium]|nr:hypothetical protein [Bacteroidota bacterium]
MKNFFFFLFAVSIFSSAKASNENFSLGARSSAMGNASVSLTDVWSAHHNQSGLGFVRQFSAGTYFENKFLLKELSVKGLALALPIKAGTIGICITSFGYSLYSENKYSISFSKTFSDKLSAGIAMDYLNTKIAEGYGSKNAFVAEAGIQAKPLKELSIGIHLFNPTRAKLAGYNDERIPTIFRLGVDYNFSNKVILAIETKKDISEKAIFKAGIEYKAIKEFYLRGGISTNPSLSSFGFGLDLNNFKIDLSANYHQVLGISTQLSLSYIFKKNK